jgi:hypothetical protein
MNVETFKKIEYHLNKYEKLRSTNSLDPHTEKEAADKIKKTVELLQLLLLQYYNDNITINLSNQLNSLNMNTNGYIDRYVALLKNYVNVANDAEHMRKTNKILEITESYLDRTFP